MARYRVEHKRTKEVWEVEADYAEAARLAIGWRLGDCLVYAWQQPPFAELQPPRVAVQVVPPEPGADQICPECNATMYQDREQPVWQRCPACELIYHTLEHRYLREEEL
ncbi:MAG: hypothetical protein JW862_19980 [Anaerolineales bacterium]|nr:hypothetical protein [Anaerolineales bacterium]